MISALEEVIDDIAQRHKNDSSRLSALANFAKTQLELYGLPGVRGGTGGELCAPGIGRSKDWDVAYEFVGKFRLLVSLKSLWKNASGTVPNRIDDLMGEAANIQQLAPEIVIGYILLFDTAADSRRREDGLLWSEFFERAVRKIAIRGAPLWNQGLLEASWFILINSAGPKGSKLVDPNKAQTEGTLFFKNLIRKLHQREPAIPFSRPPLEL